MSLLPAQFAVDYLQKGGRKLDRRFIKRPLALFAGGFSLAAGLFHYLPAYFLLFLSVAVITGVLSLLPGRTGNKRVTIASFAVIAGFAWCFIFQTVFEGLGLKLTLWLLEAQQSGSPGISGVIIYILGIPGKIAGAVGGSIDNIFPERLAPFIRAITIGDASSLKADATVYTPLMISGIAHIVAVSGMHVSFLISMISPFLRGRRSRAVAAIPLLLLFMAVSGFSPSVCRAVIMHIFVIIAPLCKRRSDGTTSVFAALLALVITNPASITSVGLQLSFLSTLGLVLLNPVISNTFTDAAKKAPALQKRYVRSVCRFVISGFSTSLSALAFSLPLTAYYFGYVAVFAPITNLITLWAASFAFCGGIIASILGLIFEPLGLAAAWIAGIPADWIIFAAKLITRIPFAAVYISNTYILGWLLYVYAAVVILVLLKGRLRAVLWTLGSSAVTLVLALLLTATVPAGGLRITVLDVGQGQSIVLTDSNASAVIDCGGTYGGSGQSAPVAAASYLQENAALPVDALILTHFHADHAGGVPDLLSREQFNTLIIPDPSLGDVTELEDEIISLAVELGIDIIVVTETLEMSFGSSIITVFPPFGDVDENEACLTVLVSDGSWDALITGDMPSRTELLLLEYADLPDTELFIAGHHGSKYSSSNDLLEEITPEIVIISVGAENSYGHPASEALKRFADIGAEVYRTDISGSITVKSGRGGN